MIVYTFELLFLINVHIDKSFRVYAFLFGFVQTDPFNRSHLSVDMLIPNDELKARIEEFVRSQQMKKHNEGLSLQSTKDTIQTTYGEMLID